MLFFASTSVENVSILEKFGVDWQLLSIQILNFLLVSYFLYKFAFKPIIRTMDERRKKINDGLEYTEKMRVELDSTNKNCAKMLNDASENANQIIRDARDNAEQLNEKQLNDARRQAVEILDKAKIEIEIEKNKMITDVKADIKSLVISVSEQVLSKNLNDSDKIRYNESVAEIISQKNS